MSARDDGCERSAVLTPSEKIVILGQRYPSPIEAIRCAKTQSCTAERGSQRRRHQFHANHSAAWYAETSGPVRNVFTKASCPSVSQASPALIAKSAKHASSSGEPSSVRSQAADISNLPGNAASTLPTQPYSSDHPLPA